MDDDPIPVSTQPLQPENSARAALARLLKAGKGAKWTRIAMQCVAGAIGALPGGTAAVCFGALAGGLGGLVGAWADRQQDEVNWSLSALPKPRPR